MLRSLRKLWRFIWSNAGLMFRHENELAKFSAEQDARFQLADTRERLLFLFAFMAMQIACTAVYFLTVLASKRSIVPIVTFLVTLCLHAAVAFAFLRRLSLAVKWPSVLCSWHDWMMSAAIVLDGFFLALARSDTQHYLHYKIENLPQFFYLHAFACEEDGDLGVAQEDVCLIRFSQMAHNLTQFWMIYFVIFVLRSDHALLSTVLSMVAYVALSILGTSSIHLPVSGAHGDFNLYFGEHMWLVVCLLVALLSRKITANTKRCAFLEIERQRVQAIREKVLRYEAEFRSERLSMLENNSSHNDDSTVGSYITHGCVGHNFELEQKPNVYAPRAHSCASAPACLTARAGCDFKDFINCSASHSSAGSDCGCPDGGDCLRSDALVWVEGHASARPLSSLEEGQRILCYDVLSRSPKYATVFKISSAEMGAASDWVVVNLKDGTKLEMTADHPCHCTSSSPSDSTVRCMVAGRLRPGQDELMSMKMSSVAVSSVEHGLGVAPDPHVSRIKLHIQQPERHMCFVAQGAQRQPQQIMAIGASNLLPQATKKPGHEKSRIKSAPPSVAYGMESALAIPCESIAQLEDALGIELTQNDGFQIHIPIQLMSGKIIEVVAAPQASIGDLQILLASKLQVSSSQILLSSGVQVLRTNELVADVPIRSLKAVVMQPPRLLYAIGGGNDELGGATRCLNLTLMEWQALPSLNPPRHLASAAVLGRHIYVCGGWQGRRALKNFERLNLDADGKWERLPPLPRAVQASAVVSAGGFIYVCGGFYRGHAVPYVQRFDPVLKRWDAMPPMLVPRGNSAAVTIGVEDRIVVCGGNDGVQVLNVVESFDPVGHVWEQLPGMNERRSCPSAVAVRERIVVACGNNGQGALNTVEQFQLGTQAWEAMPPAPEPRVKAGATVHDGCLHICGGTDANNVACGNTFKYCPDTDDLKQGSWEMCESIEELPAPRDGIAWAMLDVK